ncbi:MAG: hypothetical protein KatS3mg126_1018 [Lysobacteraceae bacterium]|nr:MAG: hypothetical protein KatS3mg126_1018 [Xanthomonadaceae bacterium]
MLATPLLDRLAACGFVVAHDLLPPALAARLAADCRALQQAGDLRPAHVGRGSQRLRERALRGDSIRWIEPDPAVPARAELLGRLDALRVALNRHLLLGLADIELHYAVYPAGAGYVRHRDRFRDDDARTVSFTAYLNPHWSAEDGGWLRLHVAGGPVDVLPALGTCTLFLSAEVEHEVLPARRERMSIAGWFRRYRELPLS